MLHRRAIHPVAAKTASTAAAHTKTQIVPSPVASPFIISSLLVGGANLLGFGISVLTGSHLHLDIIGTGVFTVAALSTAGTELRQRVSAGAISLWGLKLAGFLFYRALQTHHDGRLTETLSSTNGALGFWTISAVWAIIVLLPHTIAAVVPVGMRPSNSCASSRLLGVCGLVAFFAGLGIETTADFQKWNFKGDAANAGNVCDVGVWKLSQHPNWFGNILLWTGITLINVPTLLAASGSAFTRAIRLFAGCASPCFMLALFYAQATDTLANTRALADAKYGDNPQYQAYVSGTPLVIPNVDAVTRWLSVAR